jgi:hypothetical protein
MNPPVKGIEPGGEVDVRPQAHVRCTCGLWVLIGEFGDKDEPIVLHPLPQCKLFVGTDLLTYIRTLRQHYEGN